MSNTEDQYGAVAAGLDNVVSSQVSLSHSWSDLISEYGSNFHETLNQHKTQINSIDALVKTFVSEELKEDIPTGTSPFGYKLTSSFFLVSGMTPQRRDFSYPRTLSKTHPQSDLLQYYRSSKTLEQVPEISGDDEQVI